MPSPPKHVLKLLVPESVVPLLKQHLPEKEYKKKLSRYLWPIHLILEKQSQDTDRVFKQNGGFVHLHSIKDIKDVIKDEPVMSTLKALGVIYCKESKQSKETYTKGEQTKSYSLFDELQFDNIVEYQVIDRNFTGYVNEWRQKDIYKPKPGVERHLRKAFNDIELNYYAKTFCDLKRALTVLREATEKFNTTDHEKLRKRLPAKIRAIEANGHTVDYVLDSLKCISSYKQGRYNADIQHINQFKTGEIFFKRVPNGKRIFTTANLMSRELRRFIRHKGGTSLFEADIRNCQPLMLCGLLKKRYRGSWPEDVLRYKNLCESGEFYEYMHRVIYGIELNDTAEEHRISFKVVMFGKVFYCKVFTSRNEGNIFARAFENEFPNVYKFIDEYKCKHGYKDLSREMQRVESRIVLDTVCAQLWKSTSFVVSIHDGLIVSENEIDQVVGLLHKVCNEDYNLTPTIQKKPLRPHDIELYKRFEYLAK
ncbi:hypothetical protein H8S95_01030 [Pontibacter sp. KCTC 32443]|uniref:hypothetical protein n=1 Tax=Pontibacter TaxID=323449 RepID=UPI00164D2269|nr:MULTISPECIES: hypothetical protein [Pontibacter]MBC5772630.1 hypothetical protein [Pontibacter sp. KCTC 32443]